MKLEDRIRQHVRDTPTHLPPVDQILHPAAGMRGGRALATGAVVTAVVLVAVAVTSLFLRPTLSVVDDPPVAMTTTEVVLLDGTRLALTLPFDLAGHDIEYAGSLYAAASIGEITGQTPGWRVDVTRTTLSDAIPEGTDFEVPTTSPADGVRLDLPERRLGIAFGAWVAVISGDRLSQDDASMLLGAVSFTPTSDTTIEYDGQLVLWPVDSPDARYTRGSSAVSVFLRDCLQDLHGSTRTQTGLLIDQFQVDGFSRTVFCEGDEHVEVWVDSPGPLGEASRSRIDIEVLDRGSTLTAVQQDRYPDTASGAAPTETPSQLVLGALPDGTLYELIVPGDWNVGEVEGVGGVVVWDEPDAVRAIGVTRWARWRQEGLPAVSQAEIINGRLIVPAGEWAMVVDLYDWSLGREEELVQIVGREVHGLPVLDLPPGLRWPIAELPNHLTVYHGEATVREGCQEGTRGLVCSPDGRVGVGKSNQQSTLDFDADLTGVRIRTLSRGG